MQGDLLELPLVLARRSYTATAKSTAPHSPCPPSTRDLQCAVVPDAYTASTALLGDQPLLDGDRGAQRTAHKSGETADAGYWARAFAFRYIERLVLAVPPGHIDDFVRELLAQPRWWTRTRTDTRSCWELPPCRTTPALTCSTICIR